MKRWCVSILALAISLSGTLAAQTASPSTAGTPSASANPDNQIKGAIPVKLEKSIDSKKLKEGDTVVFQTVSSVHSRSGLMIPSGSKVIGHVTQAKARSKGDSESTLAISFDKIEYGKGEDLPMKGTLQAVGPNLGGNSLGTGAEQPALSTKGGNGSSPPPTSSMQISGPTTGTRILSASSQGVVGVKGLDMDSSGVLTSPGKEVKLDNGDQILIHAEIDLPSH
jgi:hypothetical protein